MTDFLLHHLSHFIRHCPHAFAYLGFALQTCLQTDINVPVFIRHNPGLLLHDSLLHHGASFHTGMDLITSTIKEAGINKDDTFFCDTNALFEVQCRSALFVHDTNLECIDRQA